MKIKDILAEGRPSVSFEIFPPRKDAPFAPVKETVERLALEKPSFMSVTWIWMRRLFVSYSTPSAMLFPSTETPAPKLPTVLSRF